MFATAKKQVAWRDSGCLNRFDRIANRLRSRFTVSCLAKMRRYEIISSLVNTVFVRVMHLSVLYPQSATTFSAKSKCPSKPDLNIFKSGCRPHGNGP